MVYGKLAAAIIGFLVAGPIGLIVGLFVGHFFDRGLKHTFGFGSPEHIARVRELFFETSFLLMGHIAKADGRVSEDEVALAEQVMQQLGVKAGERQTAIALFKRGAQAGFRPEPSVAKFVESCGSHSQVVLTLLRFLVSMALADGTLDTAERSALESIARQLGFPAGQFARLLEMIQAQTQFHQSSGKAHSADLLGEAYRALGVVADCDDRTLKRAYRKLMSEHHPDKLIAQGVPEEMIKVATEKSQDIQGAYELIKKSRK